MTTEIIRFKAELDPMPEAWSWASVGRESKETPYFQRSEIIKEKFVQTL
jgi:hypothetical protein